MGDPVGVRLVVLQPTPFCNIDCSYCYLSNRNAKMTMPREVIVSTFRSLFDGGSCSQNLQILWHAGEPTTLPISYFVDAFEIIDYLRPDSMRVEHHIQTNAILLTQDWCDFILSRNVILGVSIDGPKTIHDLHRRRRNGASTHAAVMRSISLLQANNIKFHCLAVLTRAALKQAKEMFFFFESLNVELVSFNVEEIEGANKHSSLDDEGAIADYKRFLATYLGLISATNSQQRVREIVDVATRIVAGPENGITNELTEPFRIVTVDCDGNFSTFCPELMAAPHHSRGNAVLGNFLKDTIKDVRATQKFKAMAAEIELGVQRCRTECSYFNICGGGAPANKLWETGRFDATETMWCRFRIKASTEVFLRHLADAAQTYSPSGGQNE